DVVRHRTARWRGVHAKTMQVINHEPLEYRFKQLLIAVEQGVCDDAETFIEGLPISTVRNCSHRLMFVPGARMPFSEDVSLDVLADLVRLSPFHFLRSFKQSFGEPPCRYWTGWRIERAKALLASRRTSVTEIALDVGLHGTSAFSATFHRVT